MKRQARCTSWWLGLTLGAWLFAPPCPVGSQTVGTTYQQLDARMSAGATVVVETVDGQRTKGRLRSWSESGLVFDTVDARKVPFATM